MKKDIAIKILIAIGLIVIPFFTVPAYSSREPKMAVAVVIAAAVVMLGLYRGGLKPFKNYWVLILLGYFIFCLWLAPMPSFPFKIQIGQKILSFNIIGVMQQNGVDIHNLLSWRFIGYAFLFALGLRTIAGIAVNKEDKYKFLSIVSWTGFLMAVYCVWQAVDIEQFCRLAGTLHATAPKVGGTMGQPTIVAPFLAFTLPAILYLRKHFKFVVVIAALCATQSQVAMGAAVLGLLFYWGTMSKGKSILAGLIAITLITGTAIGFKTMHRQGIVGDGGRFGHWKNAVEQLIGKPKEIKRVKCADPVEYQKQHIDNTFYDGETGEIIYYETRPRHALTGFGPGTFIYTYHTQNDNTMFEAHSEPVEFLWEVGFIGMSILLAAFVFLFSTCVYTPMNKAIIAGVVTMLICSGGTFVFHSGVYLFYTIVALGILSNREDSNV